MTSIITNLSFLKKITNDLIKPRKLNYSEQCLSYYVNQSKFNIQEIKEVRNSHNNLLKITLIKHQLNHQSQFYDINEKCIVFVHGLGSSRLQGLPIVQNLPFQYCLCIFDLSGSGKSEGNNITYGVRQQQDIQTILTVLSQKYSINKFILWGRSMGAVSCLLYATKISTIQQKSDMLQKVQCLVIDSPFYDFAEITKHIALQKMSFPALFLDIALHFIKQSFDKILLDNQTNECYNPFQIKFDKPINSKIPAIFIASEKDQVVPFEHCERITKNYKYDYDKVIMKNISHNQQRPTEVIQQVFYKIKKHCQKTQRKKVRLLDSTLRQNSVDSMYSRKKGINLAHSISKNKQAFSDIINLNEPYDRRKSTGKGISISVQFTKHRNSLQIKNKNISPRIQKVCIVKRFYQSIDNNTNDILNRKLTGVGGQQNMRTLKDAKYCRQNKFVRKMDVKLHNQRYL